MAHPIDDRSACAAWLERLVEDVVRSEQLSSQRLSTIQATRFLTHRLESMPVCCRHAAG